MRDDKLPAAGLSSVSIVVHLASSSFTKSSSCWPKGDICSHFASCSVRHFSNMLFSIASIAHLSSLPLVMQIMTHMHSMNSVIRLKQNTSAFADQPPSSPTSFGMNSLNANAKLPMVDMRCWLPSLSHFPSPKSDRRMSCLILSSAGPSG